MTSNEIESFLLLTILSLSYSTSLRRVERLRRAVMLDRVPDLLGVWTFTAAMVLPVPLIAVFVVVANLGEWPSRKAVSGGRPVKYAVSTAATATWCVAASRVMDRVGGLFGVALGVAAFCLLGVGFVALVVSLSGHGRVLRQMLSDPKAHLVEVATQALGAAVGTAMTLLHPAVAVLALPCLYVVHLAALRHAVDATDSYDSAAGLWSEEAWKVQAADLIAEGEYVIVVTADVGLSDPKVVTEVIRGCLRVSDPIGWYGDNQIVAVSVVGVAVGGLAIADRVGSSLRRAGSGMAHGCRTARDEDLSEMLMLAGSDLMAARDQAAAASRG